jgi:hypothetical protein
MPTPVCRPCRGLWIASDIVPGGYHHRLISAVPPAQQNLFNAIVGIEAVIFLNPKNYYN